MPWIAVVCLCLVGACSFDADYRGGIYTCRDGKCPSGLLCSPDKVCVASPEDAAIDTPTDVMIDATLHALTCSDPGLLTATGPITGNTSVDVSMISPQCKNMNMLGYDHVYRLDGVTAGKQVLISISATWTAVAYMVQPCSASTCVENTYAVPGAPVTVTVLAGDAPFIVVDSYLAASRGEYTLDVAITN